ncbi:envelope-like protein [Trifolium medium]|uniref:Envelope-like protein n=1 Tax=Trifolium medium TaxID=97028 RepID=A0A392LX31_9FABA|nr:envelope-like protein [Trifolium medium]
MSESFQTTKTTRSTRSKAKTEASKIISDVVPLTTMHASDIQPQSDVAEKKGKTKSVEKKRKTAKVSETLSSTVVESEIKGSKKKRRNYESRIPLTMSDLVFESNVTTSVETSAKPVIDPLNPKSDEAKIGETVNPSSVETKTTENPTTVDPKSSENLGNVAVNDVVVSSDNVQADTQNNPEPTDEPTLAEIMIKMANQTVPEKDVVPVVGTSLNPQKVVDTVLEETALKNDVEKDVGTTVTPSVSFDEDSDPDEEGTTETEEDTQSDESNQDTPTGEKDNAADKSLDTGKEKTDVVDVDTYELVKRTPIKPLGGITKRLRSSSGHAIPTSSTATAPRSKTTGVGPKKGWSKVSVPSSKKKESLKRKKASSSDTDYDVAEDVPHISSPISKKKSAVKKSSQAVEEAPCDNISFHRAAFAQRWDFVYFRRLAVERELTRDALKSQDIFDLIKDAGLLKTISEFSACYELLVKEFLVNIPEECDNPLSKDYHKVYVRGKCINFSPTLINEYLGRTVESKPELEVSNNAVGSELTGGKIKVWPKSNLIPTSKLTVKYAILNRIGSTNWVPTTHATNVATGLGRFIYTIGTKFNFDYGSFIFDQTVKHIRSTAIKMPIAFPSLLCGIILHQHPDIIIATDAPMKRPKAFTFHHKLFGNHNVADIVGTSHQSTGATALMSRSEIIAALKSQCQELDKQKDKIEEKKLMFVRMIQTLEAEDAAVKDNAVAEGEPKDDDEDENSDTVIATDVEDDDSSDSAEE